MHSKESTVYKERQIEEIVGMSGKGLCVPKGIESVQIRKERMTI